MCQVLKINALARGLAPWRSFSGERENVTAGNADIPPTAPTRIRKQPEFHNKTSPKRQEKADWGSGVSAPPPVTQEAAN